MYGVSNNEVHKRKFISLLNQQAGKSTYQRHLAIRLNSMINILNARPVDYVAGIVCVKVLIQRIG